ncbi:MAG: hypothetical protein R3E08_03990 [Thiotrichaceae bacterium]
MKIHSVKHPKHIHWIFYLIIFISIEILIFFGLRHNYEEQRQMVADQYINNLRGTYQIVLNTLGLVSQTIFDEMVNRPEVIELLKQANQSTPEQQQILRQQLYQKLQPIQVSERLKKQKLKLINFYLANNSHFLDIDLDNDMPSSAAGFNSELKLNFDQALSSQGFREGAQGSYFRYIFPLLESQQPVASVELAMSFEAS